MASTMPVNKPLPQLGRRQTRAALGLLLTGVGLLLSSPAPAQSSTDPLLVSVAGPVDEAWALLDTAPLSIKALTTAESLIRKADGLLAPALGPEAPGRWARAHGVDSLLLIELFNRFNETADRIQEARRFQGSVVWAIDADTRAYLAGKAKRLEAARKALPKDRFQLFLASGEDGDPPATVTRPWTTRSSPRYGFDLGRFRRECTTDLTPDGRVTIDRHVAPAPWLPGGINGPIRPLVGPSPARPPQGGATTACRPSRQ